MRRARCTPRSPPQRRMRTSRRRHPRSRSAISPAASGAPERFFGLHVFNPVTRMELIEICFGEDVREGLRERVLSWCAALGKTAIEVPDQTGFVVNRLLFPYLFEAVRLKEDTGDERRGRRRLHARSAPVTRWDR